jgi:drug/metabolite transporter (DMT)-like permease
VRKYELLVLTSAKWIGTTLGVAGAILIALNIGAVVYGFILFLISSLLWSAVAVVQREHSLMVLQASFSVINVVGIIQWMS